MIIVNFIYPPIPSRTMDYEAYRDGYEPGDPLGHGETEQDAINDLIDQEEA